MPVGWRYGKWVYDEPPASSTPQAANAVCTQHMLHHGRPCPHLGSTGSRRLTTTAN